MKELASARIFFSLVSGADNISRETRLCRNFFRMVRPLHSDKLFGAERSKRICIPSFQRSPLSTKNPNIIPTNTGVSKMQSKLRPPSAVKRPRDFSFTSASEEVGLIITVK